MVLAKIHQIEHRNGVGGAVTDIGILAVTIGNVREAAAVAARAGKEERKRAGDSENTREKEKVMGGWHCSESIGDVGRSARLQRRLQQLEIFLRNISSKPVFL